MSRTPVSTSGEVIVAVASHLSNVPSIATDALTWNLIELPSCKIAKTGTSSRPPDGSNADVIRHRANNRMGSPHLLATGDKRAYPLDDRVIARRCEQLS